MSPKQDKKIKELHSRIQEIPIAIVGMSAIFPESKNLQAYWDNIVKEVDCIIDVPETRWNLEDYYDPDPEKEDKTYCKRGGFIPEIDFDPMEFGLPPNILEVTDVHQLLSLVLAKEVLRDGGYENASDELRQNIGVILGVGGGQKMMIPLVSRLQYPVWERVLKNAGVSDGDTSKIVEKIKKAYVGWEENAFPGALGNVIAGRIANRLDLGGTNSVVDAACASSLSGIRMAISELLEYRADMMITGGVDTDNSPYMYLCFSKTQAFTAADKSTPFSANSDGMIMGEGIGMLLLKRLKDAERDNDRIYAVIKGMGSSSDGKFKSIYAPRAKGQELALKRAYRDAAIDPGTIGLLEAHGTGTAAGDLAEVTALKNFFSQQDKEKQHIAMGSVKSQIGHTKNAAGAAGIIKMALSLYHKTLPATINIDEPNRDLDLENSPFFLNTKVRPWFHYSDKHPRRAGLSAFGFGGTNFHYILEEHQSKAEGNYRMHQVSYPVILNAKTIDELVAACKETTALLSDKKADLKLAHLVDEQKNAKIPQSNARLGFVAVNAKEAVDFLTKAIEKLESEPDAEAWNTRKGLYFQKKGIDPKGKVVALFAGQGSPYLNMGKELINNFPILMKNQQFMDRLFIEDNRPPLSSILYPRPVFDKKTAKQQEKELNLTQNAQPSIGVFSAGQYQILNQAGFKPDFTAGHSFGELTALWAAGVLNDEDYFKLAKARGKAMAAPDDPNFDAGAMVAVMGDVKNLADDIKDFKGVTIANYNSKSQVVIAGPTEEVIKAQEAIKDKYRTILLGVSAAFHTELVGHAQKPFAEDIEKASFKKPACKVYSNASAKPYPQTPKSIQKTLKDHILNSVQFKQEIENIYDDGGRIFVEFGPQSILTRLVDNILEGKSYISVALNANAKKESDRQFREGIVKLKVAGLSLSDFDPYQYKPAVSDKKKNALTLKISGTNYVSEKTRRVFEDALQDGFKIKQAEAVTSLTTQNNPQKPIMSNSENETNKKVSVTPQGDSLTYAMQSLERGLANFYNHQNETLRIHEQFLNNQSEYSRSFFQIMQQQAQTGAPTLSKDVSQSIGQFHSHQAETLRVHEQYLRHQTEYSKHSFELIRQQQAAFTGGSQIAAPQSVTITDYQPPAYPAPTPPKIEQIKPITPQPVQPAATPPAQPVPPAQTVEEPVVESISADTLTKALLEVVAEKTGYQSDMLELSMDMEADLGIDSIKRVEILNGIQEQLPELPQLNPEELAELRTLEQIADYMKTHAGGFEPAKSQPEPEPQVAQGPAPAADRNGFVGVLLNVISEKTGYQADMLEMDMDMEADLGIDSIKRVEILNGLQEQMPDMPSVNPEELAELRTLQQIADYVMGKSVIEEASAPVQSAPQADQTSGLEILTKALLEVVSEKTGYLEDMLELSMDLEADLGIDSIKRVEILNGIQEKLPDMPETNPEELAELRTLEQIVNKMIQAGSPITAAKTENVKKKQVIANTASIAG